MTRDDITSIANRFIAVKNGVEIQNPPTIDKLRALAQHVRDHGVPQGHKLLRILDHEIALRKEGA